MRHNSDAGCIIADTIRTSDYRHTDRWRRLYKSAERVIKYSHRTLRRPTKNGIDHQKSRGRWGATTALWRGTKVRLDRKIGGASTDELDDYDRNVAGHI